MQGDEGENTCTRCAPFMSRAAEAAVCGSASFICGTEISGDVGRYREILL